MLRKNFLSTVTIQLKTFVSDCFPDFSIIPKQIETHTNFESFNTFSISTMRALSNDEKIMNGD